ncbi:phage baseplate assembly protein V [Endozoicomonas ascidiicola]|uniref:phage baseplate assembly protein V n=1 Tax=Endozoicomonas ascidiicola TaxID=1698521 RepID=UPI00082CDC51|nr:phage baseplate assembly protein V [Endozoicomonas ascidiicola]
MSRFDISELYRLLNNLIQFARVDSLVDFPEGKRAVCITADGLKTKPLPIGTERAGDDQTSWLPSMGEQVLMFSPGGITEQAVIGPSLWSADHPAPGNDPNEPVMSFTDGARISYNKQSHTLSAILPAGATVAIVATGGLSFDGDLSVTGNITATGDVSDGKRSMQADRAIFNGHTHTGDSGGNTSPPKQNQ